jgi:imidazolonepropionase-like amidohydrolase
MSAKTKPIRDIRSLENNENIALVMKDGKVVKEEKR